MKAWLNGALIDADAACIPISDRGFTLGDGVFTTLGVRAGAARRWRAHLMRLCGSAKALGIEAEPMLGVLARGLRAVIRANGMVQGSARITLSRGLGPRGLAPPEAPTLTALITCAPQAGAAAHPPAPAWLGLSEVTRAASAFTARHKTLSYLDNVRALASARAVWGAIDEALVLDDAGGVCGGAAANLFWLREGALFTASLQAPVLPGVTRAAVLRLAQALGAQVCELDRPTDLSALTSAEAVFLTNSLIGVRAVSRLSTPVGDHAFEPAHRLLVALQEAERDDDD